MVRADSCPDRYAVVYKVLDLFSGIGGFSLGLERTGGFETVAFCEIEKYPQRVLAKHWRNVPIYEDVRELTYERLKSDGLKPDVICGGFPCQDVSKAGKGAGIGEGTRSGLWSECARLLGEVRPRYAIFENVTVLLSGDNGRWFEQILWDISKVGYDAEWSCIRASEFGAYHFRDRVWILAYPSSKRLQGSQKDRYIAKQRQEQQQHPARLFRGIREVSPVEPTIRRMDDGIPNYSHRIKALGNAIYPPIAEYIGNQILKHENP